MGSFASGLSGVISGGTSAKAIKDDEPSKPVKEYKPIVANPSEYKKGGKVRKTGKAKVHKGERVLTKKQAKRYEKRGRK